VAFPNGTTKTVNQILSAAQQAGYFSQIISVDELRTFKPSPAVYAYVTRSVAAAILRFCSESTMRIASRLSLVSLFFSARDPPSFGSLITRWLSLKEAPSFLIGLEPGDTSFSKRALASFVRVTILDELEPGITNGEIRLATRSTAGLD
jgi:hypothetical protein